MVSIKPVSYTCQSLTCLGSGLLNLLALINFGTIGHPVPCSMPCSCRMRDSPPSFISTGLTLIGPSRPHPPISGPSALGPQGTGIAPRSSFTPLLDSSQGVGWQLVHVLWYKKRTLRPLDASNMTKAWHLEWNGM